MGNSSRYTRRTTRAGLWWKSEGSERGQATANWRERHSGLGRPIRCYRAAGKEDRTTANRCPWRLTPDNSLTGRSPLSFALAGSGGIDTKSSDNNILKLQAKLLLPIAEGINVPLSATWANRADLIDEARINGQVGFTFDVAQILSALRLR